MYAPAAVRAPGLALLAGLFAADLMAAVSRTRLISCSDAPVNLFGLSFAGWDALSTLFVGVLSWRGVSARRDAMI